VCQQHTYSVRAGFRLPTQLAGWNVTVKGFVIENPRAYPEGVVDRLRVVLANDGTARPVPHRSHSYDIEDGEFLYVVHFSPVTGNVILVATWAQRPAPECKPAASSYDRVVIHYHPWPRIDKSFHCRDWLVY
jgi:hypothetical protein